MFVVFLPMVAWDETFLRVLSVEKTATDAAAAVAVDGQAGQAPVKDASQLVSEFLHSMVSNLNIGVVSEGRSHDASAWQREVAQFPPKAVTSTDNISMGKALLDNLERWFMGMTLENILRYLSDAGYTTLLLCVVIDAAAPNAVLVQNRWVGC